jgi:uncharacterized protein YkwD
MKVLLVICVLALTPILDAQDLFRIAHANQPEAARLFKIYRESTDLAGREQAVDALIQLDPQAILALVPILEFDWQVALKNYRTGLQRASTDFARKKMSDPTFGKEVTTLRATMARLRSGKTPPTKEQLQGEGQKSLERLRALHAITKADFIALQPALGPQGDVVRALTRMRATLKAKTKLKNDTEFTEENLAQEEAAALGRGFRTNPAAERVLEANSAMAAKKDVPADEAEGVRDLNEIRMLLGLPPCLMDPKLCNAARDHSKEMAAKNFFAHESPVPGKKTPWDRAKLAGTTASAENIAMGMKTPQAANHGWFLSPGHHVNMLGNHVRVGIGRHNVHWTQMFGN